MITINTRKPTFHQYQADIASYIDKSIKPRVILCQKLLVTSINNQSRRAHAQTAKKTKKRKESV